MNIPSRLQLAAKVLKKQTFVLEIWRERGQEGPFVSRYFTNYSLKPNMWDIIGMIAGVDTNVELIIAKVTGFHQVFAARDDKGKWEYRLQEIERLNYDRPSKELKDVPESRIFCVFEKCILKQTKHGWERTISSWGVE